MNACTPKKKKNLLNIGVYGLNGKGFLTVIV